MSNATPSHPEHEMLLRSADEDLATAEALELDRHLAGCEDCRRRLETLQGTLAAYRRFHEAVLKTSLPPPPRQWDPLEPRMAGRGNSAPRRHARVLGFPSKRWLAAAAAVSIAFLLVRRFERTPEVKAAELLDKAVAADRAAPQPRRRIRIRTRKHTWDRPARLAPPDAGGASPESGDASEIKAMFDAAGYGWEDPLSAAAFSRWRERLPEKHDQVTTVSGSGSARSYVIRTSTSTAAVSDGTLTLRAPDLHAVACTLRFRSEETIDMTELAGENASTESPERSPAPAHLATPQLPETAAPPAGASEELRVIAALHRIGADLGEPVEVKRDGSTLLITGTGLEGSRQEQVRTAVSGIPGVRLQFEEARGHGFHATGEPRRAAPRADGANPLISELQARLGASVSTADLTDQLLDDTDKAMERAYALRALARRFPREVERQLTAGDSQVMKSILRDHAEALSRSLREAHRLLTSILPSADPAQAASGDIFSDWQSAAEAVLASVQQLDQALNGPSGAEEDIAGRKARLAQALGRLEEQLARFRGREASVQR